MRRRRSWLKEGGGWALRMRQDQGCWKRHGTRDRAQDQEQELEPVVCQELYHMGL